jgi:hypothetical protein
MSLTKISTAMISQSAAAVDLNVDAGTFYVDTTNNRVGVGGKTDPDTPLHVIGTATATTFAGSGASLTDIPNSALTNSSITINSTAVSLGGSLTLTTANIAENTNLYYTDARADARIAAADTDDLSEGSSNLYYTDARVDARVSGGSLGNITTTGYLRGPASFVIDPASHGDDTGTVVIAGNLQVDGTTTTINSTTLTVDDKNITLASGSVNAAAADGAGFTVDIGTGTNPAITYDGTNDEWDFNKPLNVTGNIVVSGTVDGVDIATRDAVLTSTTTTANAALPLAGGTMTGPLNIQTNLLLSSDGSNSIISESGAGGLFLRGSSISVQNASNANMIEALSAGAVTLYHNGAPKIATSSSGASITGIVNVTGNIVVSGTVDGVDIATRDAVLTSTTTTAGAALPKAGGTMTGGLIVQASTGQLRLQGTSNTNKNVSIFYNESADYGQINVDESGVNQKDLWITGLNLKFGRNTSSESMRINSDGKVGIAEGGVIYASRFSAGKPANHVPGAALTSSPHAFYSEAELGGTTGNDQKIAVFAGSDASNVSGLALYRYRRSTGTNWTTDGFSLRQEVDSTANIFNYMNFAGGNVGIGTTDPGWALDIRGPNSGVQLQIGRSVGGSQGTAWLGADGTGFHMSPGTYASGGFTVGAPALKILATSGNVGIGTATPQKKFHIEHTAGASEGILISGASDTVGHTAGILLRAEGGEADSALRAKAGIFLERVAGGYGVGKLHIANRQNGDNVSATVSDAQITIYDNKVGIGTDSPGALLDLETAGNTADGTYYSTMTINNTGSSTYSGVRFDRSGSARWRVGIMPDDKFQIAKLYNGVGDDTFVIDSSGNVGIGTDTPFTTARLQIKTDTNKNLAFQTGTTETSGIKINAFNDAANTNIPLELNGSVTLLKTGETERLRITSAGKVAIGAGGAGTSGTHTKLEVHGAIAAGSAQGTGGSLVLYQRYGVNDMPATLSTHYSTSYWLLATGMKARSGASGYVSSLGNYSIAKAGIDVNNSAINFLYVPAATHAVDTVLTPRSPFYMNLDTGTLELRTTVNTVRGYISAQETNVGGTHGAGLIIATSSGESITFKDSGIGGDTNMVITGSGNVEIPNGQLILGDTDSRVGQMYIYGTGNNYLRWFGTSGNDFEIDLQGTGSTGKLAFNQLDLALSTQSSRLIVGASASTDSLYGTTSVPAIGIFGEGAYASCGAHIEIAGDGDIGWSPIYINKFDWQSGDDTRWISFGVNGYGTDSGTLSYDGTNFAIVNGSDYRLKENIVDYSGGLAKIEELQVRSYNKKEGVSRDITQQGFIAHEAALANIPGLVLGAKDAMKEDEMGNTVPDYQTINREALIPYLVSAIQELTARVRELENS